MPRPWSERLSLAAAAGLALVIFGCLLATAEAEPSTFREPQGRPEPGRGTTGSGSSRTASRDESLRSRPSDSQGEQANDLDTFMRQVMERRDDNWKKLQQYILDEREQLDIRGPGGLPLWGSRTDFTWFIRDGYFVKSPLKVNGVTVGEDDRRKYEADYLRRAQNREKRDKENEEVPNDIQGFIQQTRQPEFVSSAYFLRFKFDAGRYALVGREKFEGRDVLRVEYYPTKLFSDDEERARRRRQDQRESRAVPNDPGVDDTVNRLMNRGSRVTLWIEPTARQIVKYTFDNIDLDFFPAQWAASVTGIHASMTMGQPFPDVWLPRDFQFEAGVMFAVGEVDIRNTVSYHDYRQAEATTAIRVPGVR